VTNLIVAGCGLLGTSVARAYRAQHPNATIVGIEPDTHARDTAAKLSVYSQVVPRVKDTQGIAGLSTDNSIGIAATPPAHLAGCLLELAQVCHLVMDVGSIKGPVISELQSIATTNRVVPDNERTGQSVLGHVVPCHPMAGSEDRGPTAGRADLFAGRSVFVVPIAASLAEKVQLAHEFWRGLGAETEEIDAATHDQAVAYTSHLPHLLASVFMEVESPQAAAAGTGFMGFTRLAKANPEMWSQVLVANRQAWQPLLQRYIELLQQADQLVASGDTGAVKDWLEQRRQERLVIDTQENQL